MNVIKGNIIELAENNQFDVLIQGCNCYNLMGAGLALALQTRWPEVYDADTQFQFVSMYDKLGNFSKVRVPAGDHYITVINAYTQYNTSRGEDVFEYDAFKLILQKILFHYGHLRIGLPLIGCGLANGNKDIIMSMIEVFSNDVKQKGGNVTVVEYV